MKTANSLWLRLAPWIVSLCFLARFGPGDAEAVVITIDPGEVGASFPSLTIPFDDLNGTVLGGQGLDVDIRFDDMKFLQFLFGDDDLGSAVFVELRFTHDLGGLIGSPPFPSGFLSGMDGNPVAVPQGVGSGQTESRFDYTISFIESEVDRLIFHGIHFDITLPDRPEGRITGAEVGFSFVLPQDRIRVGIIPEPPSLALTGIAALLGLAHALRGRTRPRAAGGTGGQATSGTQMNN